MNNIILYYMIKSFLFTLSIINILLSLYHTIKYYKFYKKPFHTSEYPISHKYFIINITYIHTNRIIFNLIYNYKSNYKSFNIKILFFFILQYILSSILGLSFFYIKIIFLLYNILKFKYSMIKNFSRII